MLLVKELYQALSTEEDQSIVSECTALHLQYKSTIECFSNIPESLPLDETIQRVQDCMVQKDDIESQIIEQGCLCDYIEQQYRNTIQNFKTEILNIWYDLPLGEIFYKAQDYQQKLQYLEKQMSINGCL